MVNITLVVFSSEGCNPCKELLAEAEALQKSMPFKVILYDHSKHRELIGKHGILTFPTVFIFSGEELLGKFSGYRPGILKETMANVGGNGK